MIKNWLVTYEVNMNASHYEYVNVKANTERKAKILAKEKLRKSGYFFTKFISCNEIIDFKRVSKE